MTTNAEALQQLIASARGQRPASLACSEAEDALNVALALLVEMAVGNDRIDRLERLVADLRNEPLEAITELRFDGEAAQARSEARDALLVRAMRIFLDPRRTSS